MEKKTSAALLFTVFLLHSYILLSTAANGGRMLLRVKAVDMKDYDAAQANPKHDPHRDPDFDRPTDPHDEPPHQADPSREPEPPHQADPSHEPEPPRQADPSHEPEPPRQADPWHETAPPSDRSSILHHAHHQRRPTAIQTQAPVNIPVPAPAAVTINDGIRP